MNKGLFVLLAALFTSAPVLAAEDFSGIPLSPTYKDVQQFIQDLAAKYPKNVKLHDLAPGDDGQMIQYLEVGNGPVHNLVVGTHHGNEYGATEVTKAFAQSIAENPIVGQTVFVIPVLNTSGFDQRDRYESNAAGNVIDPNRDYTGPCVQTTPWQLKSTSALAKFLDDEQIVASATLHTYWPAVVYPWGISTQDLSTPYDDIWVKIVTAATQFDNYQTGRNTTIIYPADGTFEDYAYWHSGVWSILWEIGDTHTPTDDQVHQWQSTDAPGLRAQLLASPTSRATDHGFTGKCDNGLSTFLDKHDE